MNIFDKYLNYWPPLAGTLLFLLLGLLLWITGSRAMERSKKQLDWVRKYRKGGYPFAADNLKAAPVRWYGILLAVLAGALVAVLKQMNANMSLVHSWTVFLRSRYLLARITISAIGSLGVFLLVRTLFGSPLTAALGTALFISAPRTGYEICCLLAMSLLFLLRYLRCGKTGFAAELLYFLGVVLFVMCLSLWQQVIWLAPFVIGLHWYRLRWLSRYNEIRSGNLALRLLIALVVWAVAIALCALLRVFLLAGFRLYPLRSVVSLADFTLCFRDLMTHIGDSLLCIPMRSMLLDPMITAPVLGLGFWGLIFAVSQLRKRKNVRSAFVLWVAAAFGLTWLLTSASILLLPLTLAACFLIRGAIAGGKTREAVAICLLGVLFHIAMSVGAWYLPMTPALRIRII